MKPEEMEAMKKEADTAPQIQERHLYTRPRTSSDSTFHASSHRPVAITTDYEDRSLHLSQSPGRADERPTVAAACEVAVLVYSGQHALLQQVMSRELVLAPPCEGMERVVSLHRGDHLDWSHAVFGRWKPESGLFSITDFLWL